MYRKEKKTSTESDMYKPFRRHEYDVYVHIFWGWCLRYHQRVGVVDICVTAHTPSGACRVDGVELVLRELRLCSM